MTVGVVDQAGADVDDVPVALEEHRANRALGDVEEAGQIYGGGGGEVVGGGTGETATVEEAGQIYGGDGGEVVGRVLVERLTGEEARVVYETVDAAETPGRLVHHALRGVDLGDVALDGQEARLIT